MSKYEEYQERVIRYVQRYQDSRAEFPAHSDIRKHILKKNLTPDEARFIVESLVRQGRLDEVFITTPAGRRKIRFMVSSGEDA